MRLFTNNSNSLPDRDPKAVEANARFFGLRESGGYKGWIDQDGYRVDDVDQWIDDHRR
ncbi:MAG: hypothetical protein ACRDSP_00025 [Pseudonocardiaceae bacterium]